ncbi:hypothetical protein RND71_009830 [Anisodus tanguticus]|uniref:Sas10 C-terminal domain-containing protein n=1 Tax=Anisodus tanguticus TaxID=243964 RepID=A0AAE1SII7_9SOLA|nr:hypothetical protein RND71_009830 [Anisodus tanguticus]
MVENGPILIEVIMGQDSSLCYLRVKTGLRFDLGPGPNIEAEAPRRSACACTAPRPRFMKRDIIPLNVNEDSAESDEDNEHPVYDLKVTRKYLKATLGGVEDEMHDEAEEEKEERPLWGRGKNIYYQNKENVEVDSSDEDLIAEEDAEVLRMQQKKAKSLSAADFGIEDDEPTFDEILAQGKSGSAVSADEEAKNGTGTAYEEVQKDLNALTKEEQMDVVYSSAPELVGLLSELGEALEELDNKVNPPLNTINGENMIKGGMHYIEVKKLLLLSYCQAITFYLLLKSEGQPVRDHPVISRLVEIKNLLNKMKELDRNLPSELEDFLHKNVDNVTGVKLAGRNMPHEAELVEENGLKSQRKNESKRKRQDDQVGIQSMEMLKVRAALEEKLKHTGVLSSIARKHEKQNKRSRLLNGSLATPDDFDDDAMGAGDDRETRSINKLSRLVISGDDDLPKRDDIGERRRKHEMRFLAGAGVEPFDDVKDEPGDHASDDVAATSDDSEMDSDLEFYKVEKQHSVKVAAKEKMYSRSPATPLAPETLVDGKRQINYQMEKNRGLTRNRKKQDKNPRKKYRVSG